MKKVWLCVVVMLFVAGFSGCKKDLTESVDRPDISGDEGNVMNVADSSEDDADGRLVKKMEADDVWNPNPGYVVGSGRLIIQSVVENSDVYGYVDFEAGQIDNNSFKELNDKGISADIVYDYGGCLLLMDDDWPYSYDTSRNEFSKEINLKKHDLDGFSVSYFIQMDDDRYLCAFEASDDGLQEQVIILERSSDNNDNRKVIRMAGIYEDDNSLKFAVNAHNRTDSEYRIEYVSYGMDGKPPVDEMMRDIMTGNIPDIYVLERMNVDNLIAKGMLEDLTPFMEKDAVYPGYPSESGSGVYIQTTKSTFVMSSASENKEAAWGILKELMTGDYDRYNYDSDYGIPVSKKEFEKMVTRAVATQKYTAEDGTEIEPQNIVDAHYNIKIGPAGEDDITRLKELIGRAVFRINNDPVLEVMQDDIIKYLDGSRSLEDTVNVIQDKMTKYVNENS